MGNLMKMNDFVGAGFHKLDDNLLEQHPPMIAWGQLVRQMGNKEQIRYYQRIASAMNHAAFLIQNERNSLIELIGLKERQLIAQSEAMAANNGMLQSEVTRMNQDRQQMLDTIVKLNAELRTAKAAK